MCEEKRCLSLVSSVGVRRILGWGALILCSGFLAAGASRAGEGGASNGLRLRLVCDAQQVLRGEPLHLRVTVENLGPDAVLLPTNWTRYGPEVQPLFELFKQRAGDARKMQGNPFYFPFGTNDTVERLDPGQKYRSRRVGITFEEPGEYTLVSCLTSDGRWTQASPVRLPPGTQPLTCWAGRIESAPLVINILAPEREDDAAALRLLLTASNGGERPLSRIFIDPEDAVYRKVVELYPASRYAKHCRYVLGCRYAGMYRQHHDPADLEAARNYLAAVVNDPDQSFYLRDDAILDLARVNLEAARHHGSIARGLLEKIARECPQSDRFDEVLQLWPQVTVFPRAGPYPPPTALPLPPATPAPPATGPAPLAPRLPPPTPTPLPLGEVLVETGSGPRLLLAAALSGLLLGLLLAALISRLRRRPR
jgi:hypothetical protein